MNMKTVSLLLLLTWGAAGAELVSVGGALSVEKEEPKENGEVKYDPPAILSVRKLVISELRIVQRLKQIWRELNESSTRMDVQKILNT